jgi:hypothetical protein
MRCWWRRREREFAPERIYPSYVRTEDDRHRWDLARQAAENVAAEIGGDGVTALLVTWSLYLSDIPTH